MSEDDFKNGIENNKGFQEVKAIAQEEHAGVLPICAEIEAEISNMEADEKRTVFVRYGLDGIGA